MKTQFKRIAYVCIIVLLFNACSTDDSELLEQDVISLEVETEKSSLSSLCIQHSFVPPITQEYNVSQFGFCTVSFDIGTVFTLIPPGSNNIRYMIQVIEGPLDHPDGPTGPPPVVHNFIFDSLDDIDNDTFDILYRFSNPNAPTPTFGFATDHHKQLKVSFGVFNEGIGVFCNPFKPENVFFITSDDCPF